MARVPLVKADTVDDEMVSAIFGWVTAMESAVPNHFYVEMNFPVHEGQALVDEDPVGGR